MVQAAKTAKNTLKTVLRCENELQAANRLLGAFSEPVLAIGNILPVPFECEEDLQVYLLRTFEMSDNTTASSITFKNTLYETKI